MFEIWEIIGFSGGEPQPFILNKSFDNFTEAYIEFQKLIKTTPCCIILNKEKK